MSRITVCLKVAINHMRHPFRLRLEVAFTVHRVGRAHAGHAARYTDPIPLQHFNLARIVCHQAHAPYVEIAQDLDGVIVLPRIIGEA